MEKEATTDLMTAGTEDPDWWAYQRVPAVARMARDAGLLYARPYRPARPAWSAVMTRWNCAI